ncbi:MAG TPA: FAD-dependent oxidoreductase, partial [Bacteroides sp.]|nr:FAD-dependent oxidoreductase [Bacteroides sp.]
MKRRNFFKLSIPAVAGMSIHSCQVNDSSDHRVEDGKLIEKARQTEIKGRYDIIICGAGPAGVCSAISAARSGASILLVEVNGCLGGVWTAGLLSWILDWEDKEGLLAEITGKLIKDSGTPENYQGRNFPFDVEKMKALLEELCLETGRIDILLHTRLVDAVRREKDITHIITESKSGREAWEGEIFIDCSGDGDLAALAGCEFEMGDPETGLTQPFSMLAMISGVTLNEIEPFVRNNNDMSSKKRLLEQFTEAGLNPSIKTPGIYPIRNDLFMVMFNHVYEKSGIDTRDVTSATIRSRQEINVLVNGLKSIGGPWKNLYLVATAEHIG